MKKLVIFIKIIAHCKNNYVLIKCIFTLTSESYYMADNKLLSLNELFSEKLFRIPDFQRGYSWEKTSLKIFGMI